MRWLSAGPRRPRLLHLDARALNSTKAVCGIAAPFTTTRDVTKVTCVACLRMVRPPLTTFHHDLTRDIDVSAVVAIGDISNGQFRCQSFHLKRLTHVKDRADHAGFDTTMVTVEPEWHSLIIRDRA